MMRHALGKVFKVHQKILSGEVAAFPYRRKTRRVAVIIVHTGISVVLTRKYRDTNIGIFLR